MTVDPALCTLVEQSARGFGLRHGEHLRAVEAQLVSGFAVELRDEIVELGWSSSLSDDSLDRDDEAQLLAVLVTELASTSAALASVLLAHHFCRLIVDPANERSAWFGLDAHVGNRRLGPTLQIDHDHLGAQLRGSMRLVLGGAYATHWLGLARNAHQQECLLLVERAAATKLETVATLGLRGLGAADGAFVDVDANRFRSIAVGQDVPTIIDAAFRFIAPGLLALLLALTDQTRELAAAHASHRRQNGVLLEEIPAVRELLLAIERAQALIRVTARAFPEPPAAAALLLGDAAQAVKRATDAGLQVLGGAGYIVGHGLERLWRDARQACELVPKMT